MLSGHFRNTDLVQNLYHKSSFIQRKTSLNVGRACTHIHDPTILFVMCLLIYGLRYLYFIPDVQKIAQLFYWCNVQSIPQSRGPHSVQVSLFFWNMIASLHPNLALLIVYHSFPRAFDGIVSGMMVQTGWHLTYSFFQVSTVQNTPYSNIFLFTCCLDKLKCKVIKLSCCTSLHACHFTTKWSTESMFYLIVHLHSKELKLYIRRIYTYHCRQQHNTFASIFKSGKRRKIHNLRIVPCIHSNINW